MVQLQALNDMLNNNNIDQYIAQGITKKYFSEYYDEFNFIVNHYNTYNKVPDWETFLAKFNDFEVVEVLEPVKYIIYNLKEEYLFDQGVKVFKEASTILEQNAFDGLNNIVVKAQKLLDNTVISEGTNINDMVEQKKKDLDHKRQMGGMLGISSGMQELDRILNGWLPGEELVTIVGRVNQGKSWLLQKFLTEANKQNKRVLHYSGEMGVLQVAYRNDTLGLNYSNSQLMRGTIADGDYEQYMQDMEKNKQLAEYRVVTPNDFGGKMLTVSMLRTLIKKHKPDIIGIDQISLMEDERRLKGDATRTQYTHIAQDLFNMSTEFGIPIIVDAQANRNKADVDKPENPELADIGESDGIAQNSSRVISLVQTKSGLSLKITKNRYGENNKKLLYVWDIDCGVFSYVVEEQQEDNNDDYVDAGLPLRNNRELNEITDVF